MPTTVDSSGTSHLALCTSCGWRGTLTLTRAAANTQAIEHERSSNGCGHRAYDRAYSASSRANR